MGLNILKISIIHKMIYRFNSILNKIARSFNVQIRKLILKFILKCKGLIVAKVTLKINTRLEEDIT